MEVVDVPLSSLAHDEKNARKHSPRNIEEVKRSLEAFGQHAPLVVQRKGNRVLVGNARLEAMRALGWETAAVVFVDDDDETAVRRALADNRTAELAEWDDAVLAELLSSLGEVPADVPGWSDEELRAILTDYSGAMASDDDFDVDEATEEAASGPTRCQPGDVWALGAHRLGCGDSTCPDHILAVAGGAVANALITDPPYGVSYVEGKRWLGRGHRAIDNDSLTGEALQGMLRGSMAAAAPVLGKGSIYYIFSPSGPQLADFLIAILDAGWRFVSQVMWVKNAFVLGRSDYKGGHESVLVGAVESAAEEVHVTLDAIAYGWTKGSHKWRGPNNASTILNIERIQNEVAGVVVKRPRDSKLHPTMKPVELIGLLLRHSTLQGDVVLDPFGGSGTTLIACEQMGRRCVMNELDPVYVDVIMARWERLTGREASLVSRRG